MRRLFVAGAVGLLLSMTMWVPVWAADLTGGCTLQVRSFDGPDATGAVVDQASVSGPIADGAVGSQSNPFEVNPEGSVDFLFTTPTVFQNNHWSIFAQGLPVPILSGSDDNPLDVDETGILSLNDAIKALPFRVVGVFLVSGDIWGNNNGSHCSGEGYVKVLGDPIGTIPWDVAAALIVLSGLVLLVATPYSTTWEIDPTGGERLQNGPITG
jgi:hypothetical protein